MKLKTLAVALALTLAPAFALSAGCSGSHEKQVMSCSEGTTFDAETGTCVSVTT